MKPERYAIYCRGKLPRDEFTRMLIPIFTSAAVAKTFVLAFLESDNYQRDGNTLYLEGSTLSLTAEGLDDILAAADDGELSEFYSRQIRKFKYGYWNGMRPDVPTQTIEVERPEKTKRPTKPDGYITITELAATWGIIPMHARASLRDSGLTKPDYGWAFSPDEVPRIKKICGVK